MDKPVRYTDVVKSLEMGIITIKTGYNPVEETAFIAVTVSPGYTVTDEFIDIVHKNKSDLFMRTKLKEEQERQDSDGRTPE